MLGEPGLPHDDINRVLAQSLGLTTRFDTVPSSLSTPRRPISWFVLLLFKISASLDNLQEGYIMDFAVFDAGAANVDRNSDVLDDGALGSFSQGQMQSFQRLEDLQQQPSLIGFNLVSPSMSVDLSRSGSLVGSHSNEAMELDDLGGILGLDLGLGLGVDVGQPPLMQGSASTVVPSQLSHMISHASDQDMLSSSLDPIGQLPAAESEDFLHRYLPESLSRAFGSISDFQAFSLDGEHGLGGQGIGERSTSDMDISLAQGGVVDNIRGADPFGLSPINPLEAYRSPNMTSYITSDSNSGASQGPGASTASSSSYLPSSVDLVPSSLSPAVLHYDSRGRILMDASGSVGGANDGNTTGDSLSFVLSGLADASSGGTSPSVGRVRRELGGAGLGIQPATFMRRAVSSVKTPSKLGLGARKGGRTASYCNAPLPLPIPTRSKRPALMGWQGESQEHVVNAASPPKVQIRPQTPPVAVVPMHQAESRKRKRSPETDSDSDLDEDRKRAASLRREMLGLRTISVDSTGNSGDDGRERKKRRVGSLSLPSRKGKEREIQVESDGSNESSSDDEDDAYLPSRSSSPETENRAGPSTHSAKAISRLERISNSGTDSRRRSGSVQLSTTTDYGSVKYERDDSDDDLSDQYRRNKGKAKGSAALALAKITMMSGKPPTSAWGTYVPFPMEESQEELMYPVDGAEIRAGRRRRNGHIPLPVPVPHLIKKSRGRKVPYIAKEVTSRGGSSTSSSPKKRGREEAKRVFVCDVSGCGKCFVRGEHLKRHVRSIHTHDKPHPCPYEGCDKSFSRRDNLGQHVRIHLADAS